jgi:hypothetical protein
MPDGDYYAVAAGYDANTLSRFTTVCGRYPTIRGEGKPIPARGPIPRVTLDNRTHYNGTLNGVLYFGGMTRAQFDALITGVWGSYEMDDVLVTLAARNERWLFGTYNAILPLPREDVDYTRVIDGGVIDLRLTIRNPTRTTTSLSGNTTITNTQRYVEVDTTAGSVTITLPAASGTRYVMFDFRKMAGANNLIIQRAGSDLIDSVTSKTLTALNQRLVIFSDGVSAWTSVA